LADPFAPISAGARPGFEIAKPAGLKKGQFAHAKNGA
jgi:hypothetical protein